MFTLAGMGAVAIGSCLASDLGVMIEIHLLEACRAVSTADHEIMTINFGSGEECCEGRFDVASDGSLLSAFIAARRNRRNYKGGRRIIQGYCTLFVDKCP
ncbi:hypothetical protein D3C85_1299270 [compost metagenome]